MITRTKTMQRASIHFADCMEDEDAFAYGKECVRLSDLLPEGVEDGAYGTWTIRVDFEPEARPVCCDGRAEHGEHAPWCEAAPVYGPPTKPDLDETAYLQCELEAILAEAMKR